MLSDARDQAVAFLEVDLVESVHGGATRFPVDRVAESRALGWILGFTIQGEFDEERGAVRAEPIFSRCRLCPAESGDKPFD